MPCPRIVRDSRQVEPGDTFVAESEDTAVRSQHIAEAKQRGAARIIGQPGDQVDEQVAHARWTFSRLHAESLGLQLPCPVVGVTGTDGKSTVVHLVHHCLGLGAARVGTLGWHDGHTIVAAGHTTPPSNVLHEFIQSLSPDCPGLALECSSHGLHQQRLAAIVMSVVVWTGCSSDHLDYHGDEAAYAAAKMQILRQLTPGGVCIVRDEDPRAHVVVHAASGMGARPVRLGFDQMSDVRLERIGGRWRLHSTHLDVELPAVLPGPHNAWNAAAAVLAVQALGVGLETTLERLRTAPVVPGRLQRVRPEYAVYVDYAHTTQALEAVLRALRSEHPGCNLVCVFGCGGDRDPGKRRPMGQVAFRLADYVVVTNDNPRTEDPAAIAQAISAGLPVAENVDKWFGVNRVLVHLDRGQAIRMALHRAGAGGVVLIAGKGHEQEQIIGQEHRRWDDVEAAGQAMDEVFG